MKVLFKLWMISFSMTLIVVMNGCVSDTYHLALQKHRCPIVRYPAKAGFYTGQYMGLPLVIPSLPIVLIFIPSRGEGWNIAEACSAPTFFVATIGETAFAAPGWVIFGWWWPEKMEKKAPGVPDRPSSTPHPPESG